jgi:prepilin-type N-terminal cleavage/methylation domain-containing protein
MKARAFSLLELVVVTIIVAILAGLGFISYRNISEDAFDKEAKANLKLIQAAEKTYRLEEGTYYPDGVAATSIADNGEINDNLRVYLTEGASAKWDYTVYDSGDACAARTTSGGTRQHYLGISADEPVEGTGACP